MSSEKSLDLAVVICTFEREDRLRHTLDVLFSREVGSIETLELFVFVVDQARTLKRQDYPESWPLTIYYQNNLGGAGGFTRGLMEAMDQGKEWILFMDDDATPDPLSFKLLNDYILGNPSGLYALHGAMFSEEQPDVIYEAGATLKQPDGRSFDIVKRLANYAPTKPIVEDPKLAENMDIDYGAWWFFCFPREVPEQLGLPLPLFIRGDDREYGLRMKKQGIPTIPLPGLRVWHPSHTEKASTWYLLFKWRNILITKALHCESSRWTLSFEFFQRAFYRLLCGRYDIAEHMILGLEEYFRVDDTLSKQPEALLQEAREIDTRYSEVVANDTVKTSLMKKVKHRRFFYEALHTVTLNGLIFPAKKDSEFLPVIDCADFDWLAVWRLKRFGIIFSAENKIKIYRTDRLIFIGLLLRLTLVTLRLFFFYSTVKKRWKEAMPRYTARSFWDHTVKHF